MFVDGFVVKLNGLAAGAGAAGLKRPPELNMLFAGWAAVVLLFVNRFVVAGCVAVFWVWNENGLLAAGVGSMKP